MLLLLVMGREKSHLCLAFGSRSSDLDKIWHGRVNYILVSPEFALISTHYLFIMPYKQFSIGDSPEKVPGPILASKNFSNKVRYGSFEAKNQDHINKLFLGGICSPPDNMRVMWMKCAIDTHVVCVKAIYDQIILSIIYTSYIYLYLYTEGYCGEFCLCFVKMIACYFR